MSRQHLKKMADWITGLDITEERQERRKERRERKEDEATSTSDSGGGGGGGIDRTGLPWEPRSAAEVPLERALRSRILKLSTDEKVFLTEYRDSELMAPQEAVDAAEQCLKLDENLRKQRFNLVPKMVSEEQFWQRYFAAVDRVRRHLLEESAKMMGSASGEAERERESGDSLSRTTSNASQIGTKDKKGVENEGSRLGNVSMNSKSLKHMANALETAKGFRRMQDMSEAGKPSSSATKSSGKLANLRRAMEAGKQMLQRKVSSGGKQEKLVNAVWDLFDPDTDDEEWDIVKAYFPSTFRLTSQIGGAGPTTFLGHLVKHMCSFSTMSEMTTLWVQVLDEVRWHWKNMKPIPRIPKEQAPDLSCCTLHQKLMLLNNCIARKARFVARKKKPAEIVPSNAKLKDGTLCARKGHKTVLEGLKMIETGENIYIPETQEAPVLTEELMRETDEMIMKTGSVGPGLQQLLFDMQAFKAANPGCVLADFVRWYSPSDWVEKDGEKCLSSRMLEPGNMWTELFDKATPIPAVEQIPLFDMEYNGDMVVDALTEIAPSDLFEQLFIVAIVIRHAVLEEIAISVKGEEPESKVMSGVTESEEFTVSTCCRGMSASKIEKMLGAYDTVDHFIMKCKPMEHLAEEDYDYEVNEWMVI